MRVWTRLKNWVEEEAESAAQYRRLAQSAALAAKGEAGPMTDPELSITLGWRKKWRPNAAWADRYYPGFAGADAFLEKSRELRDVAVRAERESQAGTQTRPGLCGDPLVGVSGRDRGSFLCPEAEIGSGKTACRCRDGTKAGRRGRIQRLEGRAARPGKHKAWR